MPDERLAELLRQRALLSRHVAWLDAEIARASGAAPEQDRATGDTPNVDTPAPLFPSAAPVVARATPVPVVDSTLKPLAAPITNSPVTSGETGGAATPEEEPVSDAVALANKRADEIIAKYSAVDKFDPDATRRGCLMLTIGVFLIGTAILIGIYLLNYR